MCKELHCMMVDLICEQEIIISKQLDTIKVIMQDNHEKENLIRTLLSENKT